MKINSMILLTIVVIGFLVTGCYLSFTIEGNGDPVTEERFLPYFNAVNSGGNFLVNVTHGETNKLLIRAESNLLPYISASVSGKELDIEVKGIHRLDPSLPIVIDVETPALKGVSQSGSGEVHAGNFQADGFKIAESGSGNITCCVNCETIEVSLSGSGNVILEGSSGEGDFAVSGSGSVSAYDFPLERCKASISGSGCIYVHTSEFLNASISGSGSVYYHGDPRITYTISGSGRVSKSR